MKRRKKKIETEKEGNGARMKHRIIEREKE